MKKIISLLMLLSSLTLIATEKWTYYNTANTSTQLCNNNVQAIATEADGTMWFGTANGVSKFDGNNWTNYTKTEGLINNWVNSIAIDLQGNKWFGTRIGVSKFDGNNWTSYTTANGLASNSVNSIAIDAQGTKWFGMDGGGVSMFDGTTWKNYTKANGLVDNYVFSIAIDSQGNKWFGTANGVSKFDGITWTNYTSFNYIGLANISINSIAIDAQGNKWFGSHSTRVLKFDGTTWTDYSTVNGLADKFVVSVTIDSQGSQWFSLYSGGVSKFDGNNWTSYTTANGLASNSVNSIAEDAQGNKWFGTSGGVSKFDGANWTNYTTTNGLIDNSVSSIAVDAQGNKWFGTWNGASKFDGTTWTSYTTANGLVNNYVLSIAIDAQGNKWFGTYGGGVSKFDGSTWTSYTTANGLIDNSVSSIAIDAQGNKWFGTYGGGVSKFDGTTWTSYSIANGLVDNSVYSIAIDVQGNKWFGTGRGGVSKFDGTTWTSYTTANGLANHYVISTAIDAQGNKWFGTDGVVLKFNGTTWTNYTSEIGFDYSDGCDIVIDAQGNRWFGGRGVSKFDGTTWTNYTPVNGLVDDYVKSIAIDAQGNKWFGTYRGGIAVLNDGGSGPLKTKFQKGYIFIDTNKNGKQDEGEILLAHQIIKHNDQYLAQENDGWFYCSVNNGKHTFSYKPDVRWKLTIDSIVTVTATDTDTLQPIAFGVCPLKDTAAVSVQLTGSATRAFFASKYWVDVANKGTKQQKGVITLTLDTAVTDIQVVPAATSIKGNVITWDVAALLPYQHLQYQVQAKMPGIDRLRDTLRATVRFEGLEPKTNTTEQHDTLLQVLTGSYDPNDKQEKLGAGYSNGAVLRNKPLTYTIRFQNSGTDTAFNINIRDTLDANMDISTLQIEGSSHRMYFDIKAGNVVTFHFDNIMLPDSNVNKLESQGFVKYSIVPKANLSVGTRIKNTAHIYFDFNPPIVTNEVINTYVDALPQKTYNGVELKRALRVMVYPNPAKDVIHLQCSHKADVLSVELVDATGKTVYKANQFEESIPVAGLAGGIFIVKIETNGGIELQKIVKK